MRVGPVAFDQREIGLGRADQGAQIDLLCGHAQPEPPAMPAFGDQIIQPRQVKHDLFQMGMGNAVNLCGFADGGVAPGVAGRQQKHAQGIIGEFG